MNEDVAARGHAKESFGLRLAARASLADYVVSPRLSPLSGNDVYITEEYDNVAARRGTNNV